MLKNYHQIAGNAHNTSTTCFERRSKKAFRHDLTTQPKGIQFTVLDYLDLRSFPLFTTHSSYFFRTFYEEWKSVLLRLFMSSIWKNVQKIFFW